MPVALSFVIISVSLTVPLVRDITSGEYTFRQTFRTVAEGMNREEVTDMLGVADDMSDRFTSARNRELEKELPRARISGSDYFLYWYWGVHSVYVIGFDESDSVTVTAHGED